MTQERRPSAPSDGIRPSWSRSTRPLARHVVQPLQAFLDAEASSSVLLLVATVLGLLWANSPLGDSYRALWSTDIALRAGRWSISNDLRGWVADGLMTLFFLVVALEVKRELLTGELRERRRALLPVACALGGMVVPVALYLVITAGSVSARGFGIAMPTDVVFALAIVSLVPRTPPAVKAITLALAIVDDLGSILLVAVAYSRALVLPAVLLAIGIVVLYGLLWRVQVRATFVYIILGVAAWAALVPSGIPPTLAGVAVAFLTPATVFQRPSAVSREARRVADRVGDEADEDAAEWLHLGRLSREAVSPLARTEALLLPWSSYLVVPLFALAFAGVDVSSDALAAATSDRLGLAILVSRVIGKPLGIVLAAWLALRLGAWLPAGVHRRHLVAIGAAAGIPFTVSLYIARLSLPVRLVAPAMTAILVAALIAGALGFAVLTATAEQPGTPSG